jgi:hypothetical protein
VFLRYRDLLRILADTTDRPTILGPKERPEIFDRLRRLEHVEEELRQSAAEARRLAREKAELEPRFARYRQRHPETVGIKLGKPYFLRRGPAEAPPVLEHGHPGAKVGHPPTSDPFPPTPTVGCGYLSAPAPGAAVIASAESKNSAIDSSRRPLRPRPW